MKGKHTEGPWAVETPCGFPYTGIYVVSHKANKNKLFHSFIAEIRQYREPSNGEAQANAALIAQAPALLAERDRLKEINQELVVKARAWENLKISLKDMKAGLSKKHPGRTINIEVGAIFELIAALEGVN